MNRMKWKRFLHRRTKRGISLILCAAMLMGICTTNLPYSTVTAKTIAELESEIKKNEEKISKKEKELADLKKDISGQETYQKELQAQIELFNNEIELVDTKLVTIEGDITTKQTSIAALEVAIAEQKTDIDEGLEQFKERLRAMYITGNDSLASALVGSTDFYDMLSKLDLIARVAKHDDALINGLMADLQAYEDSQKDLNRQITDLELKKKEQEQEREKYANSIKSLNEKMAETDAVKQEIEREKKAVESDIAAYEKDNKDKTAEQNKIAEEIRKAEAARKKQQSASGSNGGKVYNFAGATFLWPVPGHYYISSYYGTRWGRMHAGVDIAGGGISGAKVVCGAAGYVSLVKVGCSHNYPGNCSCNGGYGNYVVVNHGNGFSTLYAHLASVTVSVGQDVTAGQLLGYVGSTGRSTGYHLHYGVMKNGSYVNPAPYLGV